MFESFVKIGYNTFVIDKIDYNTFAVSDTVPLCVQISVAQTWQEILKWHRTYLKFKNKHLKQNNGRKDNIFLKWSFQEHFISITLKSKI